MLDFVYYPVSGVMWLWHKLFGTLFGAASAAAWVLTVVFCAMTVQALLYWPRRRRDRALRHMIRLQPQLQAIRDQYGYDRRLHAREQERMLRANGFKPMMNWLPTLVALLAFYGVFHVLRSFSRTGSSLGQPGWGKEGLSAAANAGTPNYLFAADDVRAFLEARLFDVPLSAFVLEPASYAESFNISGAMPTASRIAAVAIPLMLVSSVLMVLDSRARHPHSAAQGELPGSTTGGGAIGRIIRYGMPIGLLVVGWLLPIGALIYLVATSASAALQSRCTTRVVIRNQRGGAVRFRGAGDPATPA